MNIRLIVALLLLQFQLSAQTWTYLGTPPASSQVQLLNDTLFAASNLNLFFSTDEGHTWNPILTLENAPFMGSDYVRPSAELDHNALQSIASMVLEDVLFFIVNFYTDEVNVSIQHLYRSIDRGQTIEFVYATAINTQGGFRLQMPQRLEGDKFLMHSEGTVDFAGNVTNYLISMDKGKTWVENTFAEFQEGTQKTPPFLMEMVDGKLLGVQAVRTIPFQEQDQLTLFDLPTLDIAEQNAIPIGLDSFRLRSAFYFEDNAYLFYFRVDDDGTILLAKTPDFGETWNTYRLFLNTFPEETIQHATFELINEEIYMLSPDGSYYKLTEGNPLQLDIAEIPNPKEIGGNAQVYSLNLLQEDELWATSEAGLFQHIEDASWQLPDDFVVYPSTQSITQFQDAYYLLDENEQVYTSADGVVLSPVFQAEGVQGVKGFEDAVFAFGERLFFSQDGMEWGEIMLSEVEGKVQEVLALEDELVISTDLDKFYFLRNINTGWENVDVGRRERNIVLDQATSKLYIYELPTSALDTDITIYEKTTSGDDEWIGQGASLFGELFPSSRFKILFHRDQIVKLDIAEQRLFISKDDGFTWKEERPEIGQLIDMAVSEEYMYLATRNNGIFRAEIDNILEPLETDDDDNDVERNVDLAVFMTVDKPEFAPFDNLTYTISVLNSGTETAKNVSVRFFGETDLNGLAFVEASTTKGSTRGWDNIWRDIELAPRERAVLRVTYFARFATPLTLYAEVVESEQADIDSEPSNFSVFLPNEDDEAQATAYPESESSLVQGELFQSKQEQLLLYPTLSRERINIRVAQTQAPVQVVILDMAGRIVKQAFFTDHLEVNTSQFATGAYAVHLIGQNGKVTQAKFIKI